MGPNISEPIMTPIGNIETRNPVFNPFVLNFAVTKGRIEPSVRNVMPNKKRAIHAAANTWLRLYILCYWFNLLMQDILRHTALRHFPMLQPPVLRAAC